MAKVTPGALISDARGAQGLIVFPRNRHGLYTRARVSPLNPNTARQIQVRTWTANSTAAWSNSLSPAQRQKWNEYGKLFSVPNSLGVRRPLTGFEVFVKVNFFAQQTGVSIRTDPHIPPTSIQIASITITASISSALLRVLAPTVNPGGGQIAYIQASPILNEGRSSPSGTWFTITQAFSLPGSSPNAYTAYTSHFGIPTAGKRLFVRMVSWTNTTFLPSPPAIATTQWTP